MKTPLSTATRLLLGVACFIAIIIPTILGTFIIPLGEGLDEFSHLDSMLFRFLRPHQEIRVEEGLYRPGVAPLGQGHQAPLYYWLGELFSVPLDRSEVGSFVDYQSGIQYSSEGVTLGGLNHCPYREDTTRTDVETVRFRRSMKMMRVLSALLAGAVLLLGFLAGLRIFPGREKLALAVGLFAAAVPTGIWRSAYVNNDNLLAFFAAATFCFGLSLIDAKRVRTAHWVLLAALTAATFLTKYNGIMALALLYGAVFLHILGRSSALKTVRQMTGLGTLVTIIFALLIFPTMLFNYWTAGDPLSQQAAINSTWFLYRPTSFYTILTDPFFLSIALSRFWVEYHSIAILDQRFPQIVIHSWTWTTWAASLGILAWFIRSAVKRNFVGWRGFLYATIGSLAAFIVLVQLGATFPLPGGRYLHTALLPMSALVIFGLFQLTELVPRLRKNSEKLVLTFSILTFLLCQAFTFAYLTKRYYKCRHDTDYNVDGGGDFIPLDLDGSGGEELALFHRSRNRTFFARANGDSYEMVPDWTRSVGLLGDRLLKGDTDGDGRDELIFWRPAVGLWSVIQPRSVLDYDKAISPHQETAATVETFHYQAKFGDEPFVANVLGDSREELIVYRPSRGEWYVFERRSDDAARWRKAEEGKFAPRKRKPIFFKLNGALQIANFTQKSGVLRIGSFPGGDLVSEKTLRPAENLFPIDWDGDGSDELALWSADSECLALYSLPAARPVDLCFSRNGKSFKIDRHKIVHLARRSDGSRTLAVFDKFDGTITFFDVSGALPTDKQTFAERSVFDPGWIRGMSLHEN